MQWHIANAKLSSYEPGSSINSIRPELFIGVHGQRLYHRTGLYRGHLTRSPIWSKWCCLVCVGIPSPFPQIEVLFPAVRGVSRAGGVEMCSKTVQADSVMPNAYI